VIDAILCIYKDYFFTYFKSVVPTTTDDYQSCLVMIPAEREQPQTQDDLQMHIKTAIRNFIDLMQEFE
jgi:hypothetical protein